MVDCENVALGFLADSSDFDPVAYLNKYDDLAHLSDEGLESHWHNHGKAEGRTCYGPSRKDFLLAGITKDQFGLEIAPYFRPLLPKSSGYNVKTLDVYDRERLSELARSDVAIPNELVSSIEDVDYVGSASSLAEVISNHIQPGSLNYIISSHNFEHLPNPIKFLREASHYLSDAGSLRMAIPDLRCCFDFYQWPTALTEWLQAYATDKSRPSPFDIFRHNHLMVNNFGFLAFPREGIELQNLPEELYSRLLASIEKPSALYEDVHCSFFVPASFELLIGELRLLGLTDLMVNSISGPHGNEFFVTLVKSSVVDETDSLKLEVNGKRKELLSKLNREIALKAYEYEALDASFPVKRLSVHERASSSSGPSWFLRLFRKLRNLWSTRV